MTTKASASDFLIWWTNRPDCNRIVAIRHKLKWPEYLTKLFEQRIDMGGRGRLLISTETKSPDFAQWDEKKPTCRMAHDAWGIVIHASDYQLIGALPGFVTDFNMDLRVPQ